MSFLPVRIPIQKPADRLLRILIYARYSTEEQHPSSISDQFGYCREFLRINGIDKADIRELSDPETSGELVSRAGIDQARRLIDQRWPDLYLSEDCSRLFRHTTACGEHIETVVDQGIRYIGINDGVDTAEEDWDDRLYEAAHDHARSNKLTRKRLKRKMDGLWRIGAAVGPLHPGHRRRASNPDAANPKQRGPHFDGVDPEWEPVVRKTYEKIAEGEPPWQVGQWLTREGLPKPANAKTREWTADRVIAMIRNPIYRGLELRSVTVTEKKHRSGKKRQIRNDPSKIETREMPQLRIVSDGLWYRANQAIDKRNKRKGDAQGDSHPLACIPRDSRGPLSGLFVCGACGAKMVVDGRREGGYRCSNSRRGTCWNKANPLRSLVHARIGTAIAERLLSLEGVLDHLVEYAEEVFRDSMPLRERKAKLEAEQRVLSEACDRLAHAIERGQTTLEILLKLLSERGEELTRVKAELEHVNAELEANTSLPSREQLAVSLRRNAARLLDLDRSVRHDLQQLVGTIRAVPLQQFGSNKVVLRASFELRLIAFLPPRIREWLSGNDRLPVEGRAITFPMSVDLFEQSTGPKYHAQTMELHELGYGLTPIAKELGITKRKAHIALQYGKRLRAAGLSDPFVELKEVPAAASRWRTHPRLRPAG